MFALNFYSTVVADQLRSHRKTATVRLGDKSGKYRKGMIVAVLVGTRYSPRDRVFDAVIDKVEVKQLLDLSPREIESDNPEIRRWEDMAGWLSQLYNREVIGTDTVTLSGSPRSRSCRESPGRAKRLARPRERCTDQARHWREEPQERRQRSRHRLERLALQRVEHVVAVPLRADKPGLVEDPQLA